MRNLLVIVIALLFGGGAFIFFKYGAQLVIAMTTHKGRGKWVILTYMAGAVLMIVLAAILASAPPF